MVKRILVAIPALALLFSVVYFHGLYAKIVVGVVALAAVYEMVKVAGADARPFMLIVYIFAALLGPAYVFADGFTGVIMLLTVALMSVFIALVITNRDIKDGLLTVLPMVYPGLFFVFLFAIVCVPQKPVSQFLLIIAFGASIVTDTFAYFSGRLFGKHKLAPAVSPKKTVEGAIGGTVFGTCAVFFLGHLTQPLFGIGIQPYWYLIVGFVLSVLTQFGDLSASILKRRFGVKDYGKIMPEHGGVMDRLDSVVFISPAVFGFYLLSALH